MKELFQKKGVFMKYVKSIEYDTKEFHEKNVDPKYIIKLAQNSGINGIILQKEIAQKYYHHDVPLIIKLNHRTEFLKGDPFNKDLCTIEDAIKLGAKGVAYTLYVGSLHEHRMFQEYVKIRLEAERKKIPLITWIEPMGAAIKDNSSKETLLYCVNLAQDLGAKIIMMSAPLNIVDILDIVQNVGKSKVIFTLRKFLKVHNLKQTLSYINDFGADGIVLGKNIWKRSDPLDILESVRIRFGI